MDGKEGNWLDMCTRDLSLLTKCLRMCIDCNQAIKIDELKFKG